MTHLLHFYRRMAEILFYLLKSGLSKYCCFACLYIVISQHQIYGQEITSKPSTSFDSNFSYQISIGVDVGVTNTDAVLLEGNKLIAKCKMATTDDIITGIIGAISNLFEKNQALKEKVKSINIGTTHLLPALLQRKDLNKPFVVRLGDPSTTLPPASDWPDDLKKQLLGKNIYVIKGGYEFNGKEIFPLDYEALDHLAQKAKNEKINSVAITGIFSHLNPSQEIEAGRIFKKVNPFIEVSLSHTINTHGLLARENATILNACLVDQFRRFRQVFSEAVENLGMKAEVFLTCGDVTKNLLEKIQLKEEEKFKIASDTIIKKKEPTEEKKSKKDILFENLEILSLTDIDDIARGAGLLGSGGGGNSDHGRLMVRNAINNGKTIQKISVEDLPDTALVATCAMMGSPYLGSEMLFSVEEGKNAIKELEKKLGRRIDAIIVLEAAGINATYPLFIAATLDIPVVDADCMGRAFPSLHMAAPCIYGKFEKLSAALSNGRKSEYFESDSFYSLEEKAREITIGMGGSASIAYLPMTGAEVKKWTIKGTLSLAQAIGHIIRGSQGQPFRIRLEALNKFLAQTEYRKAECIYEGKIISILKDDSHAFNMGVFIIENPQDKEMIEIGFQNENLVVRQRTTKNILVQVPDLIIVVDKNNFQPICCEELRYGQEVVVLKMTAPAKMATKEAKNVVGPQAYLIDEISQSITIPNL